MQRKPQAEGKGTTPDRLAQLDRKDLLALWAELHDAPPPRAISQVLLRQILAFDLQLQEARGRPATAPPVAGGRLLREWNGTTHSVEVTPEGYLWQGQHWRSLPAIAREITGAHWSGPRFFGLTAPRKPKRTAKLRPPAGRKQVPPKTIADADQGRGAMTKGRSA